MFTGTPDSFLGHVFRGIRAAALDRNCNLLMACGIDSGQPAWPLLSPEVAFVPVGPWNTDGLIIVSPFASEAGDRYAQDLIASGFPAVYAGDRDAGPAVVADSWGGIRQALEHLVRHGHRQIAFVAGRHSEHSDSGIRLRAFEAEMAALNLPFDPKLVAYGSHTSEGGRQAIRQIIGGGAKFTAVVASNDRSAIGVLDGLRQAGYVVPQDIALIGFDDRFEARALVPSLTTVHYPMFGLGYQAVELLLRAISGESVINELVRIPTRLVVRESCGCLPGISASVKEGTLKIQESPKITREQVISDLTQVLTAAVHNESFWLSQEEVAYLVQRLVEAFLLSLEQKDPLAFHLTLKQILERVSSRGDDMFAWQAAVTILRDQLPLIREGVASHFSHHQEEDMLHQARVAISEAARGRSTRSLLSQAREADQIGLMTSKLFTAHDEHEIFDVLVKGLPAVGIQGTTVGYYEAEGDDPVAWGVLQTPGKSTTDVPSLEPGARFPTRQFPPEGLYPEEQACHLALLPLKIQHELSGFVAFDASNLDPCADIVRQLGAALRGVRLYREAVEARRLAEEANRLKSRFLSIVSHELRTPLNLITGLSKILLDEHEAPRADSHDSLEADLRRIFIGAQHLDGLIRDVLDLASSDMGQLRLVCEPLDMTEVLEAVSAIGEQLARDKGLGWQAEIAKNLPRVWGDRTRLRQVTLNLVSNAVKFTSHGEISLIALVEHGRVMVSVNDTGLGIPLHAIITGLWNMGFRKQIFVNGHGQEEVLPLAIQQWQKKYQLPAVLITLHTWTVIHDHMKDKAHGGPFETPFAHADEAEASYSLALFPEFMDPKLFVDNKPSGFLPPGHTDKGGDVYHAPIKGHEHVGLAGIEVCDYPEGVIGSPTKASADKAMAGLNDLMDYMCKLIGDILTRFPAGVLPPVDRVTMRSPEEVAEYVKGPLNGGKSIYTLAYPP